MMNIKHVLNFVVITFFTGYVNAQNYPEDIIRKHEIVFSHPPEKIPVDHAVDAPLLGNGYTGVAISGPPEKQVYYVARNDFWRLKSSFNQSYPAVLGKIEIEIPILENASYRVVQDLYEAKTYASFQKEEVVVEICSYVSAAEDVMVIELHNKSENDIEGEVHLELPGESEVINKPPFNVVFEDDRSEGKEAGGVSWISRGFSKDVDIKSEAAIAINMLDHTANIFSLNPGGKTWLFCAFSSNFKSEDCQSEVVKKVKSVSKDQLEGIEKAHKDWWADFWAMSWVDIPDEKIEKQYYLSNYTMGSCSRDMDFPPSIFGSWITKERPAWNGDYHLNYNHMAPYYGLFSSNHIEQTTPHDAPILAMIERGKYYSRKVTGIEEGIILPVGIGPLGMETTRRNKLMEEHRAGWIESGSVEDEGLLWGQKSNSSYCVVNMASHFYHTYDLDYVRQVYPFVKSVSTFWEEYLVFEDGRYVIYNDAIHEGTVGSKNPILSLGLIPMVMKTAIDMSREIGFDVEKHKKWQHIVDHLSEYSYHKKKGKEVFRYTEEGTSWWGDNTLGIQHIYPAGQIGLDSDPKLLNVALNTIDVMQRWLDNNGSNSFFPAAARIGYNPQMIIDQLNSYIDHTYPNGFQLGNPHGIENMSTIPNTINEMLLQSHEGILKLFPVWPHEKAASFYQLRTHGAFLVSSDLQNGKVDFVKIISEKGKKCILKNPWDGSVEIIRNKTKTELVTGEILHLPTSIGETIELKAIEN